MFGPRPVLYVPTESCDHRVSREGRRNAAQVLLARYARTEYAKVRGHSHNAYLRNAGVRSRCH